MVTPQTKYGGGGPGYGAYRPPAYGGFDGPHQGNQPAFSMLGLDQAGAHDFQVGPLGNHHNQHEGSEGHLAEMLQEPRGYNDESPRHHMH